jgi:hypothetical protein
MRIKFKPEQYINDVIADISQGFSDTQIYQKFREVDESWTMTEVYDIIRKTKEYLKLLKEKDNICQKIIDIENKMKIM